MRRTTLKRTPFRRKNPDQGLKRRKQLERRQRLATVGAARRRLRPEDRIMEAEIHALPCICGCGARPEEHEVGRLHLITRGARRSRNKPWNNYPGCKRLGTWLDQDPDGVKAKAELLQLTIERGERLAAEEVQPILRQFGYYGEVNADVGHYGA